MSKAAGLAGKPSSLSGTATKTTTKRPSVAASSGPTQTSKLNVGQELLDTTWRMTVPVVLCAGLGIFIDRSLGSGPWITLLGMAIGFVLAGMLVKRQIGRWPATKLKPGSYKNYYKDEDDNKDYYND